MDNSASLKQYDFYPRLIGALCSSLNAEFETEGRENEIVLKYIPFGTREPVRIFDNYREFSTYIEGRTYTTGFSVAWHVNVLFALFAVEKKENLDYN